MKTYHHRSSLICHLRQFLFITLINLLWFQPAYAQPSPLQVGDLVQVNTGGQNLNLRSQPTTSSPVIARLINGTILQVVGGPESANGYQWWQVKGDAGTGWAAGQYLVPIDKPTNENQVDQAVAMESLIVDWRANLTCSPSGEIYSGVEYCTGLERDNQGKIIPGAVVHVLVIDLSVQGIEFQYILPEGYSDLKGPVDDRNKQLHECRDPNLPYWSGPQGGCYIDSSQKIYPTIDIATAVARAETVIQQEGRTMPLAAMINADYAASNKTHGPEGLMIVRGERLDGAVNCDDDFNAALRPWLALGKELDPTLGHLQVEINRLERDSSGIPDWIYTAIGGGPWLISKGEIIPGSTNCQGTKTLQNLEPVTNCNYAAEVTQIKNSKSRVTEGYGSGSCRATAHPAAGITRDGRWLFLVMNSTKKDPLAVARFMKDQLGVIEGMKFDGGGSAKLLFKGLQESQDIFVMPDPDQGGERHLSNYLAVYSPRGTGIRLPLSAEPKQRVYFQVIKTGETANVEIEIINTGDLTWHPDDGVVLSNEPWSLISPVIETKPLPGPIAPGQKATWTWRMNTSGVLVERFQMVQKKETFGPEVAVIIVVLPKGMENLQQQIESEIQKMITEWEQQKDAALDQLVQQIVTYAEKMISNLIQQMCGACLSPALLFGIAALVFTWFRRTR